MTRDILLRLICIPVPGLAISYVSGIITYNKYSIQEILIGSLYFIFSSYCIWRGCQWIHLKLRRYYTVKQNPLTKIVSICALCGLYGAAVAGVFSLVWMKLSKEQFNPEPISTYILLSIPAVIVFTLIYEVLYLGKERDLANEIVDTLDDELTRAEMAVLRNELDPHFIFNSLNTLSHLITHDSERANLFNNKLAQVYKYFLTNKEKKLVPVEKEFGFIKNYFFLLKIRHGNKMELHIDTDLQNFNDALIIPCALQILVENAIKHNEFTTDHPLRIYVKMEGKYLSIQNIAKQKRTRFDSFGIGLKNLRAQYLLISNKNIVVEDNGSRFKVKLPMIKLPKTEYA